MNFTFPSLALLRREQLSDLRKVRSFILISIFLAINFLVIIANWPEDQMMFYDAPEMAQNIIEIYFVIFFFTCGFAIPLLAASSIATEIDRGTFDMLSMTLLGPAGIVIGKTLSSVCFILLFFAASAPAIGTVFFLVGVDWVQLIALFCYLVLFTILCAMAGIYSSLFFRKTVDRIPGGIILVASITFFPAMFLSGIFVILFDMNYDIFFELMEFYTPIAAFKFYPTDWEFILSLCYLAVWIVILFFINVAALGRPIKTVKIPDAKPVDDIKELKNRRWTFPYYIVDPLKRKKPIADNSNPIFIKEIRYEINSPPLTLPRLAYVSLIAFLLAVKYPVFWPGLAVWLFPPLLPPLITKDFELGNMDALRLTTITPTRFIIGKLKAGFAVASFFLIAASVSAILAAFMKFQGEYTMEIVITSYLTLAVSLLTCLSFGFLASVITTRSNLAVLFSYVFLLAAFGGAFLVLDILDTMDINSDIPLIFLPFSTLFEYQNSLGRPVRVDDLYEMWRSSMIIYPLLSFAAIIFGGWYFARYKMRDN